MALEFRIIIPVQIIQRPEFFRIQKIFKMNFQKKNYSGKLSEGEVFRILHCQGYRYKAKLYLTDVLRILMQESLATGQPNSVFRFLVAFF